VPPLEGQRFAKGKSRTLTRLLLPGVSEETRHAGRDDSDA